MYFVVVKYLILVFKIRTGWQALESVLSGKCESMGIRETEDKQNSKNKKREHFVSIDVGSKWKNSWTQMCKTKWLPW